MHGTGVEGVEHLQACIGLFSRIHVAYTQALTYIMVVSGISQSL